MLGIRSLGCGRTAHGALRVVPCALVLLALAAVALAMWLPREPRFVLWRMSLEEKVGQLLLAPSPAYFSAVDGLPLAAAEKFVADYHVGGFFIDFNPDRPVSPYDVVAFRNYLQRRSKYPLVFASDFEAGPGTIIRGATSLPRAMVLGAARDHTLAFQAGQVSARESKALGFNLIFAPTADVNSAAGNPVINTRSFGSDPGLVAKLAESYVAGIQSEGLVSVVKHFPGHGGATTDSHRGVPILEGSTQEIYAAELLPFRRAIAGGARGILLGHIFAPAFDAARLASLSPAVTRMLRHDLGFQGFLITDSLGMAAITRTYGEPAACVMAFEADVDLLLTANPRACHTRLVRHLRQRADAWGKLDAKVLRILRLKQEQGLFAERSVDPAQLMYQVDTAEHRALRDRIYERAITLVKGSPPPPPPRGARLAIFNVSDEAARQNRPDRMIAELFAARAIRPSFVSIGHSASPPDLDAHTRLALDADYLLVNLVAQHKGDGSGSFSTAQIDWLSRIRQARPAAVVTVYGNPYVANLDAVRAFGTVVLTYDVGPSTTLAALRAILGEIPFRGTAPIALRDDE